MLLRRSSLVFRNNYGLFSTVTEPKVKLEEYRTSENDPRNHTTDHIGKFYRIDEKTKKTVFRYGGITKTYEKQIQTFNEPCVMVRNPAVEIIDYMKNTDFNKPIVRYVLYGGLGTGKSMSMVHLLHYGYINGFLLVHIPWLPYWYKHGREYGDSATQEGMTDIPLKTAAWLMHFKTQNIELLTKLDLKTSQDYVWSKRETTPVGASLIELVDHGINRAKYATDVIRVLFDEVKLQSNEGKVKTMVAIDGYNIIFNEKTNFKAQFKVMIPKSKISFTQPFLDITKPDWCNGVCVLSVDRLAMFGWERESDLPMYLLGREGFEHLDPFVPVRHEDYDDKEYESCIGYYVDRKWIQNVGPGFDKELKYLSNQNPYKLMDLCKSL
ncbi:CLUMA_CG017183, isoform A [Clunio marinus]|uniref:Small ribosomal subunit protein mS29 n=1 Tax=Clunio marinus TaxID=568069 RepID=A0A1J1IY53_9DIPT|nr:CLUMA_CG017183, isoform A [Clunio marinus]